MAFKPTRTNRYVKKSGVYAAPVSFSPKTAGQTRASVMSAAEVFAAQARKNAARFSRRIPASTGVESQAEQQAQVVTYGEGAPNAAPFEFGERHPLNWPNQVKALNKYGRSRYWRKQPTRAYMNSAATNSGTIDQAAEIYAQLERDLLADEYGFNE